MTDSQLEDEIQRCFDRFMDATDETAMRCWMMRMRELIAKRSAAQIERMEREKGLRA